MGELEPRETRNCRRIEGLVSAYADDQLTEAERQAVARHLEQCPQCQETLAAELTLKAQLAALPAFPVPRSFTLRQADLEPSQQMLPWWAPLRGLAVTLLAVFVLGAVGINLLLQQDTVASPPVAPAAAQATQFAALEVAKHDNEAATAMTTTTEELGTQAAGAARAAGGTDARGAPAAATVQAAAGKTAQPASGNSFVAPALLFALVAAVVLALLFRPGRR